jgi:hypothetical protein
MDRGDEEITSGADFDGLHCFGWTRQGMSGWKPLD